eukprot:g10455.t1
MQKAVSFFPGCSSDVISHNGVAAVNLYTVLISNKLQFNPPNVALSLYGQFCVGGMILISSWDECLPQVNARTEMHLRASDLTVWQHLHPICPNWKGWDECVLQVNSANRYFTQSDPRTGRRGEISSVCFPNPCYRTEVSERDPQIYEQIH